MLAESNKTVDSLLWPLLSGVLSPVAHPKYFTATAERAQSASRAFGSFAILVSPLIRILARDGKSTCLYNKHKSFVDALVRIRSVHEDFGFLGTLMSVFR